MGDLFAGPTLGDFNGPLLGSGPSVSTASGEWTPAETRIHWSANNACNHWGFDSPRIRWVAAGVRQQ